MQALFAMALFIHICAMWFVWRRILEHIFTSYVTLQIVSWYARVYDLHLTFGLSSQEQRHSHSAFLQKRRREKSVKCLQLSGYSLEELVAVVHLIDNRQFVSIRSRPSRYILIWLHTGHCRIIHHLHRLGLHESGPCAECGVSETLDHFVLYCTK